MDWIEQRIRIEFGLTDRLHAPRLVVHDVGGVTQPHSDYKDKEWALKTNIMLKCSDVGGKFIYRGEPVEWPERALLTFNCCKEHEVTPVVGGKRIMIHIGWDIDQKEKPNEHQ